MDGSGVRASAVAPEGLRTHGQVSPGTFSQPPGIRRNRTPPMQRTSLRCCCSLRSACSRRTRIAAIFACNSGSGSVCGAGIGAIVVGGVDGALKRAFQASPVFRCSQIPAPAIPSSSTAHRPIHGNSQRGFGSSDRYSGRSRSIRPPKASCAHSSRGVGAAPLRKRLTRAGEVWAPVPTGLPPLDRRQGQPSPWTTAVGAVPSMWPHRSLRRNPLCWKAFRRAPIATAPSSGAIPALGRRSATARPDLREATPGLRA